MAAVKLAHLRDARDLRALGEVQCDDESAGVVEHGLIEVQVPDEGLHCKQMTGFERMTIDTTSACNTTEV